MLLSSKAICVWWSRFILCTTQIETSHCEMDFSSQRTSNGVSKAIESHFIVRSSVINTATCCPSCKPPPGRKHQSNHMPFINPLFLLLRLLENLLHDLLLLNQKGSNNAVPNAVCASRSSIGALNGLLWSGDLRVFARSEGWDLWEGLLVHSTISWFSSIVVTKLV